MAYSDHKKAEVCADLLAGLLSCDKIAKKHQVGKATVIAWRKEIVDEGFLGGEAKKKPQSENRPKPTKTDQSPGSTVGKTDQPKSVGKDPLPDFPEARVLSRKERFFMVFEELALASLQMELAHARVLADPDFIKAKPESVNVLAESHRKRVDTLVSVIRRGDETGSQPERA